MPDKTRLPRPTDAELKILRALWKLGPSTVRQIQEMLNQSREVGYTTILKLLQIMTDKGLVVVDKSERSHVYRAKQREETTQKQLVKDLLSRAFGGSTEKLVMQALSATRATPDDISAIRQMLDALEGDQK